MTHRVVGLIGNPNVGKSALFNALTGGHAQVGNWPGVTVARQVAHLNTHGQELTLIDLPGCYACCSYTEEGALDEEEVMRFILHDTVDVFVNVIDGRYLQRHLYLTCQLIEMGIPMIVVINMNDLLLAQKIQLDDAGLAKELGCPVVRVSAKYGKGLRKLKRILATETLSSPPTPPVPDALSLGHQQLVTAMRDAKPGTSNTRLHWLARRWLEGDTMTASVFDQVHTKKLAKISHKIHQDLKDSADFLIADQRYNRIQNLLKMIQTVPNILSVWTPRLDKILLNQWLGLPLFFICMYCVFYLAIHVGGWLQVGLTTWAEFFFVTVPLDLVKMLWPQQHWLMVVMRGVGTGLTTTIALLPVVMITGLCLQILEESGYMTRAAFLVDRLMNLLQLPGRAFIAMILGFGCNVPAISATRTLASVRDRIMTVMMVPFMSCTARLTVYTALTSVFFPKHGALVLLSLYILGFGVGLLTAWLLRLAWGVVDSVPVVMEFPVYQWPRWSLLFKQVVRRGTQFAQRASKLIIVVAVMLSLLQLGQGGVWLQRVGEMMAWCLQPIGIHAHQWPLAIALLSGVLAKEVVVGTLNTLYVHPPAFDAVVYHSIGALCHKWWFLITQMLSGDVVQQGSGLMHATRQGLKAHMHSMVAAFAYLSFILLYLPCVSTLAVIARELSWRWAAWGLAWSTVLAFGVSLLIYQLGTFLQHPLFSLVVVLVAGISLISISFRLIAWVRSIKIKEAKV